MDKFYWYWLCNIKGIGNAKIRDLLSVYQTPERIYHADQNELSRIASLNKADYVEIEKSRLDTYLYEEFLNLKRKGISFVSLGDSEYPQRLKKIYDHPYGLYYKGKLPDKERPIIAIVGSRSCSSYGRTVAYEFARQFAAMGLQVISGMAVGIDTASHKGCVDGHGSSYAILGCGVDVCYPRSNIELYMEMQNNGGIISEYCPGTQPFPGLFPQRNRIISGLADVIIVVEARKRSGSLITVDQALEQNRDVFVVPGRITDPLSDGCNNLIKMGAQVITEPKDVMENYIVKQFFERSPILEKMPNEAENMEKHSNFLENNGKNSLAREKNMLYSCLNLDPKSLDEILNETRLNITIVNQILLELQIDGVIREVSKNCYIRSYM